MLAFQGCQQLIAHLTDQGFALYALVFQLTGNILVDLGIQKAKGQIFHFPLDLPNPQTIRQGRIKLQRFTRKLDRADGPGLPIPAQGLQARRQTHHHNAQVSGHRQQHLALHFLLIAPACLLLGLAGQRTQTVQGA